MKNRLFYLLSFLIITLAVHGQTSQGKKGFLSFDGAQIYSLSDPGLPGLKMAWSSNDPEIQVDSQTLYDNQPSLFIPSSEGKNVRVQFHFSNRDIVGKTVVFSGKYKCKQAHDIKVRFAIGLDTFLNTFENESTVVECDGDQDWKSFSVEMPLTRTSYFFFRLMTQGDAKLWISDCQVLIDGQSLDILVDPSSEVDKDTEFMRDSRVSLAEPTQQVLENLAVLGKVWGFLKYYHPQVVVGKYNWDFELFRILPEVAKAQSREERNRVLSKWIDKYGGITETEDYTVKDSTQYHRFAYLQWLEDPVFFDKELSDKLVKIKNAKRNGVLNYYLPPLKGKEEVEFRREKVYPGISWKDQGYRLLTLYRLWNAVEYNFPYINYTEHSWATLLDKYLPEFYSPASGNELYLSIQKLLAEINDSHGTYELSINGSDLRSLPLGLTITADGNYAVESTRLKEIERGAVIKAVNGKSVPDIIEEFRPIIASSNENTLKRDVARRIFQTKEEEEIVTIKVGSRSSKKKLRSGVYNMHEPVGRKGPEDYELDAKNITYINIGEISQEKLKELMSTRLNSKGLILDMRKYPKLYTKDILEKYLYSKPTPYMWFSMNSKTYPGNYFLDIKGNVGPKENTNYYKGKIAILVNEGTQSFGELSSIAYRVAPRSAVIGTQTAGANGHIGYLFLPYGIRINYTMSGAFYPDWGMNQRVGVKIDIPVEQTVDNVKYGEDAWIEKAIEYIEGE